MKYSTLFILCYAFTQTLTIILCTIYYILKQATLYSVDYTIHVTTWNTLLYTTFYTGTVNIPQYTILDSEVRIILFSHIKQISSVHTKTTNTIKKHFTVLTLLYTRLLNTLQSTLPPTLQQYTLHPTLQKCTLHPTLQHSPSMQILSWTQIGRRAGLLTTVLQLNIHDIMLVSAS